ncbi:MAG: hypothetical protein WA913_07650 [Pricia sp.]
MKPYIEFKKQRDLGEILSDTFAFIRNEFRPFFNAFLKIVGPYLAVMLISYGFYMYKVGDVFNFSLEIPETGANGWVILLVALAFATSLIATYALATATTLFYIKSYAANNGIIEFEAVKKQSYGALWQFIGLFILVGLCVGIGFMFCIVPGVYLYVPLSLAFAILVFNQKSVSEAFGYSFTLVKDYWWNTFACLFVVGIIVMVASYAFALPAQIYSLVKVGIWSGEVDAESITFVDPVSILLGIISTLAQFFMNIISVVASVFIYFDLNEKKNFTGTYERIKNLGGSTD